jgi:nucleotide-binding universal stress UspA family protein
LKKYRKIVVSTDFSEESSRALENALALAHATGGMVMVLHVIDSRSINVLPYAWGATSEDKMRQTSYEDMEKEVKEVLAATLADGIPFEHSVEVTLHVRRGTPHDMIVEFAKDKEASLIVIGARAHSFVEDVMLGGVTERVSRHAHCPVMIVR